MTNGEKTAVLISCSDHYGHRLFAMDAYLRSRGYRTEYITSDFDHNTKQVFRCEARPCVQLHAKPYRKNLSVARILSHRGFSRDVFRHLDRLEKQPDAVVALLPPNFLSHYAAKYKKRHPQVKLIFDIFDLWPETFPSGRVKALLKPAFAVWAWVRDHSLPAADFVTTECELFRQRLNLRADRSASVYLCAEPLALHAEPPRLRENALDACYLGAINNIVDIDRICALLKRLAECRSITLHIIGKGERQQELIDKARFAGAEVIFYGPIYDDGKKLEIMNGCHFGLNVMKESVCIGLTMKSVEYFRFGLPIVNSIPADTRRLVEREKVGITLDEQCADTIAAMDNAGWLALRRNVSRVFDERFRKDGILEQYARLFDSLL